MDVETSFVNELAQGSAPLVEWSQSHDIEESPSLLNAVGWAGLDVVGEA